MVVPEARLGDAVLAERDAEVRQVNSFTKLRQHTCNLDEKLDAKFESLCEPSVSHERRAARIRGGGY